MSLLILAGSNAMATNLPVRLWADVTSEGGLWSVVPQVDGAAGSALRYEIRARKSGPSGRSSTSQSGRVTLGAEGTGTLARLRIGIEAAGHCEVDVKVYAGSEMAGTLTLQLPP